MRRIFELPDGTHEAIQAQARGAITCVRCASCASLRMTATRPPTMSWPIRCKPLGVLPRRSKRSDVVTCSSKALPRPCSLERSRLSSRLLAPSSLLQRLLPCWNSSCGRTGWSSWAKSTTSQNTAPLALVCCRCSSARVLLTWRSKQAISRASTRPPRHGW